MVTGHCVVVYQVPAPTAFSERSAEQGFSDQLAGNGDAGRSESSVLHPAEEHGGQAGVRIGRIVVLEREEGDHFYVIVAGGAVLLYKEILLSHGHGIDCPGSGDRQGDGDGSCEARDHFEVLVLLS